MANLELTPYQWEEHIRAFLRTRSDLYIGNAPQCWRFVMNVLGMSRPGDQWQLLLTEFGTELGKTVEVIAEPLSNHIPDGHGLNRGGVIFLVQCVIQTAAIGRRVNAQRRV